MDIKKIVVAAALVLLAIIGFNYYNSAQSEQNRAERTAKTEALRASIPRPAPQADSEGLYNNQISAEPKKPQPDNLATTTAQNAVAVASDEDLFGEPEKEGLDGDSVCESVIEMSENIMRNRLNGVSIAKSLEAVNSIKDGTPANEAVSNLAKQIVIEAYERPSFSTESYKNDAIREFGAKQYLTCMRAFN